MKGELVCGSTTHGGTEVASWCYQYETMKLESHLWVCESVALSVVWLVLQ